MTDEEIFREVNSYPAHMIVLTGGEPSLWIDSEFIFKLKSVTCKNVAIETNGTNPLPQGIDWITVSPKTGMSDMGDSEVVCEYADELKVVDIGQDLDQYFSLNCVTSKTRMLLQPCHIDDPVQCEKNTRQTIRRVLEDPRWRLSLQTHRYIGVR